MWHVTRWRHENFGCLDKLHNNLSKKKKHRLFSTGHIYESKLDEIAKSKELTTKVLEKHKGMCMYTLCVKRSFLKSSKWKIHRRDCLIINKIERDATSWRKYV